VGGAGHPSFIFNVRKKPHASRVGLPRRVMKGPRGILYAYKSQDAFKRVTRKGIGWCGCQARVTCTTGEALFYFQSPVRSLWITCEVSPDRRVPGRGTLSSKSALWQRCGARQFALCPFFPGTERDAKPWRRLEAVIALSMADLESERVMLSHCGRLQAACRALRGA
jgi:hypothetical protein